MPEQDLHINMARDHYLNQHLSQQTLINFVRIYLYSLLLQALEGY